jgi:predicted ATP-grasp superfamily ATP-dependent carboligase
MKEKSTKKKGKKLPIIISSAFAVIAFFPGCSKKASPETPTITQPVPEKSAEASSVITSTADSSSIFSPENYAKIKNDMSREQILELLGETDDITIKKIDGVGEYEVWQYMSNDDDFIVVDFIDGKVTNKSGSSTVRVR